MRADLRILILMLIPAMGFGQYVDLSVDPNKALQIIDNPRTKEDHKGLDWDLEIGVTTNKVGVFLFYGRFDAADYQNYGAGVDYYFIKNRNFDLSIGSAVAVVLREHITGADWERTAWGAYMGWNLRGSGVLWLSDHFGISGRVQYQRRPEIEVKGIIEGNVGLRFQL